MEYMDLGRPRRVSKVSIARVHSGPGAPRGLFVAGILVPGVRMLVEQGGDILVVLARDAVRIEAETPPIETIPARTALPTDGAA